MRCKKCQKEIKAEDKFCSQCGELSFKAMRSENEIKAMIEQVKNFEIPSSITDNNMMFLLMKIPILVTLDWVMGSNCDPMNIITPPTKKQEVVK